MRITYREFRINNLEVRIKRNKRILGTMWLILVSQLDKNDSYRDKSNGINFLVFGGIFQLLRGFAEKRDILRE